MITGSAAGSSSDVKADFNLGYVWMISLVAAMGGLLFGYDWVVIGGAKPFFEKFFNLTSEAQIGWANSCALLGCLVGSLASGMLSDKFGRKNCCWYPPSCLPCLPYSPVGPVRSMPSCSGALSAGSPSAWPPTCHLCTLPKSLRHICADGWWPSTS